MIGSRVETIAASPAPIAAHWRAAGSLVAVLAVTAGTLFGGMKLGEQLMAELPADASGAMLDSLFSILIFGGMLAAGIAGGLLFGVNPLSPGRRVFVMLSLGLFVGIFGVAFAASYAGLADALKPNGPGQAVPLMLLWGCGIVLLQAGAEEVLFRGWLQPVLARAWGIAPAVVLSALMFAALHVMGGALAPVTLINLYLGGLLFGLLAAYGQGIAGAVAAHFSWNATEQLFLGLDPNPGIGSFGALLDFELVGAAHWGGSEEGLNASFAMSVALAALLVPLVLMVRRLLVPPRA